MQLDISGHHIEMTEALKTHVRERFEKIESHFDIITDVHCILTVEGDRHIAEATINVNGKRLFAMSENGDMYESIDKLFHKANRMIRQYKEKLHDHHAKEARHINSY